jgi:P-type Ca2+ transporter type 2C
MRHDDQGAASAFEVVHALPGRIRLRLPAIDADPLLAQRVRRALMETAGLRHAEANPVTATILVRYDGTDEVSVLGRVTEAIEVAEGKRAPVIPRWWVLNPAEVCDKLSVSRLGLSTTEADARRGRFGENRLSDAEAPSGLALFLGQLNSLPVLLLAASAAVSFIGGALIDAALIAAVVTANATIGAVTEAKANRIIRGIAEQGAGKVLVKRDGGVRELDPEEVVTGDILVLAPGMLVPADARVLDSAGLSVDESAMTGESLPVAKTVDTLAQPDAALADRTNMIFAGTLIASGHGVAVVVAVGAATELGHISAAIGTSEHRATPLQRQLARLGMGLTGVILLSSVGVVGLGLLRGRACWDMLRIAGALAVAAIPEGLPTTATVILARGLRQMQQQGVLVRHLTAVETLGSVTAICFDKTGTLTQNRMAVSRIAFNGVQIDVDDEGFRRGEQEIDPRDSHVLATMFRVAVLCNESEVNGEAHAQVLNGSSTEMALLLAAMQAGLDIAEVRSEFPVRHLEERSETRRYMTTMHNAPEGPLLAAKGNPDDILDLCDTYAEEDGSPTLDDARRAAIRARNESMSQDGLRVLGFAWRSPGHPTAGLVWLGMIGLSDPLRPGIRPVLEAFHGAGIRTVMLTGDQAGTARSIASAAGISTAPRVLDGVATMQPAALADAAGRADAFARITPTDKLRVVQALQDAGQVVAMTGDGSNDAPALRAADVGVAMAANGTVLARETADILLARDDLATMVVAVRQGRTIYANMRKALKFLVGTNASEIMLTLTATGLGIPAPLNAVQLLWLNLLTDVAVAVALGYEPPEPDLMMQPPRDPAAPILDGADYRRLALRGGLYGASALGAHLYGLARYGGTGGGIGFSTLIGAQLLEGLAGRSDASPNWAMPPNRPLRNTVIGLLGLQAAASLTPASRGLLGLAAFDLLDLAVVAVGSVLPYLAVEFGKAGARVPERGEGVGLLGPHRPAADSAVDERGIVSPSPPLGERGSAERLGEVGDRLAPANHFLPMPAG